MASNPSDVERAVGEAVLQVAAHRTPAPAEVQREQRLIADLGFDSMDIAELLAILEMKLGYDPFAASAAIADVHTVGDLIAVYERAAPIK